MQVNLCMFILSSGAPQDNLALVWQGLHNYWEDHPCGDHFTHLKLSMFVSNDDPHDTFPKLKGRAAECKSLMPALAEVWEGYMTAGDVSHQAVLQGLKSSAMLDEILDCYPDADVLPDEVARDFVDHSWLYVRCQNAVAAHFNRDEALMIFDITIKTHWVCHCAQRATHLNPRKGWNFAGEDFMHKCQVLHQSCMRGNSAPQSVVKFAGKYAYALHLLFTDMEMGLYD